MKNLAFSLEAQALLEEGRKLKHSLPRNSISAKICDEFKLGRPDVGWYEICRALKAYGDTELTDFEPSTELMPH